MQRAHGWGNVRCGHEVFAVPDAQLRDGRVEGHRQQAANGGPMSDNTCKQRQSNDAPDHHVRTRDKPLDRGGVAHVYKHGRRVRVRVGQALGVR